MHYVKHIITYYELCIIGSYGTDRRYYQDQLQHYIDLAEPPW